MTVTVTVTVTATVTHTVLVGSNMRGRVTISSNQVITDNSRPLRGDDDSALIGARLWFGDEIEGTETCSSLSTGWHLNAIRLYCFHEPQNWPGAPEPGTWGEPTVQEDITYINGVLAQCLMTGFYLIIDYHPVGGHSQEDLLAWWAVIAARYRDYTNVIFEACNEPVAWSPSSYSAQDIDDIEEMYAAIRAAAPDTHIILWSFANSNEDMESVVDAGPTISYANASVGFHPYTFSQTHFDNLVAAYPVFLSEIGGSTDQEYQDRTDQAESDGVSWLWLDGIDHPTDIEWGADPLAG